MSFLRVIAQGGAAFAKADGGAPTPPKGANYDPYISGLLPLDYSSKVHPGTWAQTYDALDWWARQPIIGLPPRVQWTAVSEFCRPSQTEWAQGFRVGLIDEKAEMSKGAERTAKEITEVLARAGGRYQWPPTADAGGNMEAAVGMFLRQSLIYDQACFEVIYTRGNKPWGWLPLDTRSFRLAIPSAAERNAGQVIPAEEHTYVQLSEAGQVIRTFGYDEMCWFIRNPRVDMRWRGYGFPEYDEMSYLIDSLYRTYVYNDANFRNGIHAHTIVLMKTAMDSTQFDAYRRQFLTMLSQPRNAHRAMVMQLLPQQPGQTEAGAENVDIKQIGQSNSEMEFSKWLELNVKLLAGGYRMDPIEWGMNFGNEGQASSLGSASVADRASMSKGRWLPRLLRQLEAAFNAAIVTKYHPDFCVRFTGIGAPSSSERLELDLKASKFLTLNELRNRHDLPPLDWEVADQVPMDATTVNAFLQTSAQGDAEGAGFEATPGDIGGLADDVMKGQNWNDTDGWTQKLGKVMHERLRRVDRGAGCVSWVASV